MPDEPSSATRHPSPDWAQVEAIIGEAVCWECGGPFVNDGSKIVVVGGARGDEYLHERCVQP